MALAADIGQHVRRHWIRADPWADPEAFLKHSPIGYVDKVKTPSLLMVGEEDYRTPAWEAEQSQEIRESLDRCNFGNVPPELQSVATQIDNLHPQTLKEIVTLYGLSSKRQVGEKDRQAIFLLVQHPQDLAQFTDNISIKLGKKQVFGTQVEFIDGKVIFAPIENEESVDQLRAQLRMPPLAEYQKKIEMLHSVQENADGEM